ncbi:MAG: outer membrane protein assembly factor BamA [Candidatus Eisenbacteria bacterium]|nr:outer membrane protein assembly factor BamA [Candidatus Eisenbacteria bacterium]
MNIGAFIGIKGRIMWGLNFLLIFAVAGPLLAQTETVKSIAVSGNIAVEEGLILSTFPLKAGQELRRDDVANGVKKLYSLGLFSDVQVEATAERDGISLVIKVKEREKISKIEFKGNKKGGTDTLKEKISTSPGQLVDGFRLAEDVEKLLSYYKEEGRPLAKIQWSKTPTETPRGVAIVFEITEGPKVKVRSISFSENQGTTEKQLRKVMATKKKGFLRSGAYKDEYADMDIEKLEAFFKNRGYKDAKVKGHFVNYSADNRWVDLNIEIDEGLRYVIGSVSWNGNKALSDKEVSDAIASQTGTLYSEERIERTRQNLFEAYAEKGYLFVAVTPEMTPQDTVLDVVYMMQEGEPSYVRDIRITGNTRTKEKVIRRELFLKPGDPFKRSLLAHGQRDVFNLRIFEDVLVDYEVDENGRDIDLIFKVKEKQTGTANAGFGYGTATGLTGFAEVGHNNLFGNNQSISLRLERGSRRSNIELSFTDPWLLDTPTTAGFEAYNAQRVLDYYTEYRKGGSVFAEKLVPRSRVVRGSVAYRYEEITLEDVSDTTLALVAGKPQRTSSVTFGLRGVTTDNPFRPKKGGRFRSSVEFAGGRIGGDVNFHKYLFDGRIYKRWLFKPVFMFRGRVGYVSGYTAKDRIPTYEKFRLGGTVYDYLRGYPDYSIHPRGNAAWDGGRFMLGYTTEYQFPIAEPLRGLLFYDVGGTWNSVSTFRASGFMQGFGFGFRIDVPMLGEIGFDYGYGINREEGARWEPHLQLGGPF